MQKVHNKCGSTNGQKDQRTDRAWAQVYITFVIKRRFFALMTVNNGTNKLHEYAFMLLSDKYHCKDLIKLLLCNVEWQ